MSAEPHIVIIGGGFSGAAVAIELLRLAPNGVRVTLLEPRQTPGAGVAYSGAADKELARLEELGFGGLPVCMAKTQYSLSDDPAKLGRPEGFTVTVSKVKVSAGAGFVVVQTGDIMTMPGLPKVPAAEKIDVDENGVISGLF